MATRRNFTRLARSAFAAADDGLSMKAPLLASPPMTASQSGYTFWRSSSMSSFFASPALRRSVSSWNLRHRVLNTEVTFPAYAAMFKLRGYGPSLSRAYSTAAISTSQINPSEFTEMAWEGIVGAVDAARVSKQQVVETEHLMKALLEQKDGLARRILTKSRP
ncbi:hypothetical protein SAY87_026127 [Trapa incisa]|uniref:Clp R domain-containing protein n=1 Tax=Trapa incisa TaxID=236973 RepID=A0AAN7GTK7_9MYRT|nr:hypothetical protein SAY87_026127 [Trapa incisa]